VSPFSRVYEDEVLRMEPWTLQVGAVSLPGGAQDKNDFEGVAIVAVVGVQELVQHKLRLSTPSLSTDDG